MSCHLNLFICIWTPSATDIRDKGNVKRMLPKSSGYMEIGVCSGIGVLVIPIDGMLLMTSLYVPTIFVSIGGSF